MDPLERPDEADIDNPYAPPKSAFEPERPVLSHSLSIPFSIDSIVNTSWAIYRDNLGTCLWIVWSVMLVNIGLGFGLQGLMAGLQAAMPGDPMSIMLIYWTFYVLSLILQSWLTIGMNLALLGVVRREQVTFDRLFSGGRYLLKVIIAGLLLVALFVVFGGLLFVPLFLGGMGAAALGNQSAWMILIVVACMAVFAVLLLYVGARLMPFYFLIIDRDAGIAESFSWGWQISRGRAGTIILVYLLQIVLAVAGFIALCVGLIFTIPLSNLLMVVTYLAMLGPVKPAERAQFSNWDDDFQPT
jgi:hypothetical protein